MIRLNLLNSIGEIWQQFRNKGLTERTCGALSDLVLFVQFRKREKHPWRSVTLSIVAGMQTLACDYTKINTPRRVFSTFLRLYK